jgi:hypothetical protein
MPKFDFAKKRGMRALVFEIEKTSEKSRRGMRILTRKITGQFGQDL